MKETFQTVLGLVFDSEGGYVDDPADPGGATHFGITLTTLSRVRGRVATKAELTALQQDEAAAIYRQKYWDTIRADDLPAGIDYAVFDAAVHSGPRQATLWLQAALKVKADGVIGPETLAAGAAADAACVIQACCDARLAMLRGLSTFNRFGRGWESRIERVRRDALGLTRKAAPSLLLQPQKGPSVDQTQSLLQSRTVWSNLIGFGALILSLTGHGAGLDTGQLTDSIMQVVTAGSFIASTVFRILSTKKVAL